MVDNKIFLFIKKNGLNYKSYGYKSSTNVDSSDIHNVELVFNLYFCIFCVKINAPLIVNKYYLNNIYCYF